MSGHVRYGLSLSHGHLSVDYTGGGGTCPSARSTPSPLSPSGPTSGCGVRVNYGYPGSRGSHLLLLQARHFHDSESVAFTLTKSGCTEQAFSAWHFGSFIIVISNLRKDLHSTQFCLHYHNQTLIDATSEVFTIFLFLNEGTEFQHGSSSGSSASFNSCSGVGGVGGGGGGMTISTSTAASSRHSLPNLDPEDPEVRV